MEVGNKTHVTEFILLGVTDWPQLNAILLWVCFVFYLVNVVGNISIITVVIREAQLHTPMYFLLGNLSLLDIGISSLTVPKMLVNLLLGKKTISFKGCFTQLYFFHFFGSTEAFLLVSMSFDRYVAICHPLRYVVIMNERVCILLASGCWISGFIHSLYHTLLASRLPFCASNQIIHFFCDFKPLFKLACANTYLNERLITLFVGSVTVVCVVIIFVSYSFIVFHVLKIKSSRGRKKAFSTCVSHLTIVIVFLVTCMCTYLRVSSRNTLNQERMAAILFTVISPTLNPFVYTLRNKEVKRALIKFMTTKCAVHFRFVYLNVFSK